MLSSELQKTEEDLRSTIKELGVECAIAVFRSRIAEEFSLRYYEKEIDYLAGK